MHPSPRPVSWFKLLLALVLLSGTWAQGCSCAEVTVNLPGCEDCPERCLRNQDNTSGRCVLCITDKHCQSDTSPTKRCTQDYRCVCGSDKDCGFGFCNPEGTCVQCFQDDHCKSPDRPFCVFDACNECKPESLRGCAPSGIDICVQGVQKCRVNGKWGACEGWKPCQGCPTQDQCNMGQKKCTSAEDKKPGTFLPCVQDDKGCYVWGKEQTCKDEQVCKGDECEPKNCPAAECKLGETRCSGSDHMQQCGRNDEDCIIWLPKTPCPKGKTCSDALKQCAEDCTPAKETCNNKDDDCDGQVDEDFPDLGKACEVGKGECKQKGAQICSNDGKSTVCNVTAKAPSTEICDKKDNDCDGQIDNGCTKPEPGCADGTRELFRDMSKWPLIAGCAGYYRGENLRNGRGGPAGCGDKNKECKSAEDLCATGWHICMKNGDPADLKTRVSGSDCATAGAGLFVAASSHCTQSQPACQYGNGTLNCGQGGPCTEPICCGSGCQFGLCKNAVWPNETRCARPKSYIGCGNANSFHGNPTITGVLCCKDKP